MQLVGGMCMARSGQPRPEPAAALLVLDGVSASRPQLTGGSAT